MPGLAWLTLSSEHELTLDGRFRRKLGHVSLTGSRVLGNPLPKKLDALSLHLSEATDEDVDALLKGVRSLHRLGLRGTPVGDEFAQGLPDRWPLDYLDLVDTNVSLECIRRIQAKHPKLRMHPNLDYADSGE